MASPMSDRKRASALVAGLQSKDARARDLAAARLGDWLETGSPDARQLRAAAEALLAGALAEPDAIAKESMFNALSSAAASPKARGIDWSPLAEALGTLAPDELEHALVVLGFSGDARYRPRVAPFLRHPDADVRAGAADALRVLGGEAPDTAVTPRSAGRTRSR